MVIRRIGVVLMLALLLLPIGVSAAGTTPAAAAEIVRSTLLQAQLDVTRDPQAAQTLLATAQSAYHATLATTIRATAPTESSQIDGAWNAAAAALQAQDSPAFAAARAHIWTGILAGSYRVVENALASNDGVTAQQWLPVREFRIATRFSRPAADATLAVDGVRAGTLAPADGVLALKAELLDTYQARLNEALNTLRIAAEKNYPSQRAEAGALANGYFAILAPSYREQRGATADATLANFAQLEQAALTGENLPAAIGAVEESLKGFRAAPLSNADQVRRAGQLLRYLALVPVEYGRGVSGNTVTRDLEIQEATTFRNGAAAAFADLDPLLQERDAAKTNQIAGLFRTLETQLSAASQHINVPGLADVQANTDSINALLQAIMPAEWRKTSLSGDFDVIASLLDQMERAAAAGQYDLAESARLEAYAVLEAGPEARLVVFAPQYKAPIEELFWYGQGDDKGLAHLISQNAPLSAIRQSRAALDEQLGQAQKVLSGSSNSPVAVGSNAAIIVFREGLEAVLILASLLGSLKLGENRKLRRPIWVGAALALLASALTWVLAHEVLQRLARYGEKLEAIVSLIAIGVLLLITNWFFHKVYWTGWMANFHSKKRSIIGGTAGIWTGMILLGFTSIYREGFETVLFLQALVLEAGVGVVLGGVAVGLGGTFLVGALVFGLQAKLPHKKMLIATGVMIGFVLLQMVGNTTHVMQVIGWLPLHPIRSLHLPYWVGMWFGLYATWEGIALQVLAGGFVVGSYVLAEHLQHRRARVATRQQQQQQRQKTA